MPTASFNEALYKVQIGMLKAKQDTGFAETLLDHDETAATIEWLQMSAEEQEDWYDTVRYPAEIS